uniref:EGF-like domain-containing protein n=1 Tax=Caenorhabditis japonica TaxID=281687 RepID=A0A8R1HUY0_CAEJA
MRECDAQEEGGPKCYPEQWYCDGYPDCHDKSDEPPTCQRACLESEFVCKSGKCLPRAYLCDGQNDCGRLPSGLRDLSDEDPAICKTSLKCDQNEYPCAKTPQCVPLSKFCDGKVDCGDGSDEHTMCHVEDPKTAEQCEYGAAMTIDGVKCFCANGKFVNSASRCEWVNRCERGKMGLSPVCSQGCEDYKNGTFRCSCFDSRLKLMNGTHCVADEKAAHPSFAILTPKEMYIVQKNSMTNFSSMPRPLGKTGAFVIVHEHPDFAAESKIPVLCVTESPSPNSSLVTCGTVSSPSIVKSYAVDFDLPAVRIMRFDVLGGNWIFSDGQFYVVLCKHEKKRIVNCATISSVGTMKDLVYDAVNGQLFVADGDMFHQGAIWRIDVATAPGAPGVRHRLTTQSTDTPAIAIDPFTEFLYYVDSASNVVRAISYNGTDPRIAVGGQIANQIKFMDFADGKLILVLKDERIFVVDTLNPDWKNWQELTPPTNGGAPKSILAVQHFQTGEHLWKRGKSKCKCDGICVSSSRSCLCRDGLAAKGSKCLEPLSNDKFLVLAQLRPSRVQILGLQEDGNAQSVGIPAILGARRPSALTFDPKQRRLLIFDRQRHSLMVQRLAEPDNFTLHGLAGVVNCEGMAYDHTADNLYMTDQARRLIVVARLANLNVQRIIVSGNMSNPRAIVVHVEKSYLFWGSWNEHENREGWPAMIERAKLDGSQRKDLKDAIKAEWDAITETELTMLVARMPNRVIKVI